MKRIIIPAILTKDLADLKRKLKMIEGLADWVQIDIMDGKFVENTSVSLRDLEKIKIPFNLELHLMVFNPEKYFKNCQKLKAKRVIWHWESAKNQGRVFRAAAKYNFQKAVALNPKTGVEKIKPYLNRLDLVLLLGVTPGFQGQSFQSLVFKKIKKLREFSKRIKIGVDGGVNLFNVKKIADAKVSNIVVGSYLFTAKNLQKNFEILRKRIL